MLYLIDSADIEAIEKIVDVFPIAGVTTNPAIIGEEQRNVRDVMRSIRSVRLKCMSRGTMSVCSSEKRRAK